ncbi:MAG: LysO family transporter [Candidatus Caldatribacteriaceae bacterium]
MWKILLALLCGFFVGKIGQNSSFLRRVGRVFTTGGLLFLLFAMGVRLGMDESIRQEFPRFGSLALGCAFASGVGAAVLANVFERLLGRRTKR